MAISESDIKVYLTGADSDGGSQNNPNLSLGKYRSSKELAERTTLAGDLAKLATRIPVADAYYFPSSGYVRIENEIIQYTNRTRYELRDCLRGALSTTPAAHSSGSVVEVIGLKLFDNVSGDERNAGDTEYRCFCIKNEHASESAANFKIYIDADTGSAADDISFAVEVPTGGDTDGYAQQIANESTAPSVGSGNVSDWSDATSYAAGVGVDQGSHDANLDAGEIVFVWVRRKVASGTSGLPNQRVLFGFGWQG